MHTILKVCKIDEQARNFPFSSIFSFVVGIPLSWTTSGFIKPGAPASTNPIPPNIVHHAALARDLTAKVEQSCKRLFGEEGDLTLLRLHTKTNEILIAPSDVANLMVVQKAHSAEMLPFLKVAEAAQLQAADEARKTRSDNSRRR